MFVTPLLKCRITTGATQKLFLVALAALGRPFFHFFVAAFAPFAVGQFLAEALDFANALLVALLTVANCLLVHLVRELHIPVLGLENDLVGSKGETGTENGQGERSDDSFH